jgi:divalent metal cation (Fe/Co/Zn/Cd) transporter
LLFRKNQQEEQLHHRPGLQASAVDSLNDVLSSSISIAGLIGIQLGYRTSME